MFVGEIAQIHTELGYASTHSVEVKCTVYAEDVVKGNRRLTNKYAWSMFFIEESVFTILKAVLSALYRNKYFSIYLVFLIMFH